MSSSYMSLYFFILFLLLNLVLVSSSFPSHNSSKPLCHDGESLALLGFKNSVNDSIAGTMASWEKGTDCCGWNRITCHPITHHVVELDLENGDFSGTIEANNSLFLLRHLHTLDLSFNYFNGEIPPIIAQLSQLRYLDLSWNYDLEMPNFKMIIDNMTKLEYLDLGGIILDIVVLQYITNLSRLSYLYLGSCKLRGELPPNILNLPYLTFLDIGDNDGVYANFKSHNWSSPLEYLDLSSVNFSSTLPSFPDQSRYQNLTNLNLANCSLHGDVPGWVWNSSGLWELDMSDNNFSGSINLNHVLSNLPNLDSLDLSRSGLFVNASDVDVTSNSTSAQLVELHLSSCNLLELQPLLKLVNLEVLDLSHNHLTGGLASLAWSNLYYVDISSNMLEGPLPASICNSTTLGLLDLSNNNLGGDFPHCLGKVSSKLTVLNLGSNRISGTLPINFSKCDNLAYLDLSGNRLHGLMPRSLAQCRNLQVLNLRSNMLSDEFPFWLDTLPLIQVLDLNSNLFHGHIRNSEAKESFPMLQILDLSNNNFSGRIPRPYIQNFRAMMKRSRDIEGLQYMETAERDGFQYSYSLVLTFNGVELKYEKVISTLATLDLSNNKFEGEIPNCIGHLVSIHCLNLSHNQLTGPIPPSISNLTLLNSLDLSHNKLTGQIPHELTRLTAMGFFNVSANQLVGPIPPGNPFDTFDEYSYKGNPGLCGFPLPKCGEDGRPMPSPPEAGDSDHDGLLSEWKVILMGCGCGTVLGLAWGYYMLSVGKPFWFVKLAHRMELAVLGFYDDQFRRRRRRRRATRGRN